MKNITVSAIDPIIAFANKNLLILQIVCNRSDELDGVYISTDNIRVYKSISELFYPIFTEEVATILNNIDFMLYSFNKSLDLEDPWIMCINFNTRTVRFKLDDYKLIVR